MSLLKFTKPSRQVAYTPPQSYTLTIDKNGYIGDKKPASGNTYYAFREMYSDYSESELGQVNIIIPEIGEVEIGGRIYKTTKIGNQTWLGYNLDLTFSGLRLDASDSNVDYQAVYYLRNQSTYGWNGRKYGLLYNWYAVDYLNSHKSELFPGWHIPSVAEWQTLNSTVGNVQVYLQSTDYWSASGIRFDAYKMRIIPGGYCYPGYDFTHYGADINCTWWTDEVGIDNSRARYVNTSTAESPPTSFHTGTDPKVNQFYVRLIKDSQ